MQENRQREEGRQGLTGPATGPQGVDKAPGEETATGPDQFVQETQRGKNKVDGDPSEKTDQPIQQP